jgi:outer membrane protein
LQRDAEDAQNDFQAEMQELYNGLASKVYDVLAGYSQQHGYTLVLDVAQQQNPVLYASESTNITKQIIDAYNLKSGVPAPPPGAPEPTKPAAKPPVGR